MPITKKTCLCGCGRTFFATSRRKWATDYCKTKNARKVKKDKELKSLKLEGRFNSEASDEQR